MGYMTNMSAQDRHGTARAMPPQGAYTVDRLNGAAASAAQKAWDQLRADYRTLQLSKLTCEYLPCKTCASVFCA